MKLIFLLLFLISSLAFSTLIPDERLAPWQGNVGVLGGIPVRNTIWKNIVTDLGADPTGATDCSTILYNAITTCPAGQVVYIPAGTFLINSRVYTPYANNVTVRGAGIGRTILIPGPNLVSSVMFLVGVSQGSNPATNYAVTGGATKGSTTITMADTATFAVGKAMFVGPSRLPSWAHNLGTGFSDATPTIGSIVKIISKTPTTVTFDPPLPFDYSTLGPAAACYPYAMAQGVGFEDLTADMRNILVFAPFEFTNVWGSWLQNVEVLPKGRDFYFEMALRCEIRKCYFHDAYGAVVQPGNEGADLATRCCWNLVVDNIFKVAGFPQLIFSDAGNRTTGNVMAYNYFTGRTPPGYDATFSHGLGSMLNLAEGNVMEMYEDDGYFGSASHQTLLRNVIASNLKIKQMNNYYNVVGNVIGNLGDRTIYEPTTSNYSTLPVYEMGYPNAGNASFTGTFGPTTPPDYSGRSNVIGGPDNETRDLNVNDTVIRKGNWNGVDNGVPAGEALNGETIPNGYYLTAKPAWFGSLAWPPIGPDRSPIAGLIPAQVRYTVMTTSPTPTATATATATPSATFTPTPTATFTPTPTATFTPTPSATFTPTPTPTPTATALILRFSGTIEVPQ